MSLNQAVHIQSLSSGAHQITHPQWTQLQDDRTTSDERFRNNQRERERMCTKRDPKIGRSIPSSRNSHNADATLRLSRAGQKVLKRLRRLISLQQPWATPASWLAIYPIDCTALHQPSSQPHPRSFASSRRTARPRRPRGSGRRRELAHPKHVTRNPSQLPYVANFGRNYILR